MKVCHYHFLSILSAVQDRAHEPVKQLVLVKTRLLFPVAVAMYQIKVVPSELETGIDV